MGEELRLHQKEKSMKFEYHGQVYFDESAGKKKVKLLNTDQPGIDIQKYDEGDRVVMKLETFYRKMSKDQRGALHWYFDEIAKFTGHTKDEIKEMLKAKFLLVPMTDANGNEVVDARTGQVEMVVKETRSLSTVETMAFMAEIKEWAWEVLQLFLPEPDKNWKLNLK